MAFAGMDRKRLTLDRLKPTTNNIQSFQYPLLDPARGLPLARSQSSADRLAPVLIPRKIHHPPHSLAHLLAQPSFTTDDTRAAHSTRRRSPRSLDRRNKENNSRMERPGTCPPFAADPGARISRPHNPP